MGEANRVTGILTRLDETMGLVRIGALSSRLPHRGLLEGRVDVAIRPEALVIGAGDATGGAVLRGTVSRAAYLGSRMDYGIATEIGEPFVTSLDASVPLAPDAPVCLTLADHGVTLLRP